MWFVVTIFNLFFVFFDRITKKAKLFDMAHKFFEYHFGDITITKYIGNK